MNETKIALERNVDSVAATIAAYVQQITSGDYGAEWAIWRERPDTVGDELLDTVTIYGGDDEQAVAAYVAAHGNPGGELYATLDVEHDEPTVHGTPLYEWPLEVVDERGREFAVVLATGGPHIEVVADGVRSARLVGYWAGEKVTYVGDVYDSFLNYFIER